MKIIQETFLETDWDSEDEARAARDARAEQLQEQGMGCSYENLYNVLDGRRIFLLQAKEVEPVEVSDANKEWSRPNPKPKRLSRALPKYEER